MTEHYQYVLTDKQCHECARIGCERQIFAWQNPEYDPLYSQYGRNSWHFWIEGAGGECTVGIHTGERPSGVLPPEEMKKYPRHGPPDVGDFIDVRRTGLWTGELAVKITDCATRLWVLVVGDMPKYSIAGWLYGWEAMQVKHVGRYDGPDKSLKYLIRQHALRPPYLLNDEIAKIKKEPTLLSSPIVSEYLADPNDSLPWRAYHRDGGVEHNTRYVATQWELWKKEREALCSQSNG